MFQASETRQRWIRLAGGSILAIALTLNAAAVRAGDGRCYSADVPGVVVLPDGSRHASSTLRICDDRAISPVTELHRIYIDGLPVGMFLSVSRALETSVEEGTARFIFERNGREKLVLIGYVVSDGNETKLYRVTRGEARLLARISSIDELEERNVVILVARAR